MKQTSAVSNLVLKSVVGNEAAIKKVNGLLRDCEFGYLDKTMRDISHSPWIGRKVPLQLSPLFSSVERVRAFTVFNKKNKKTNFIGFIFPIFEIEGVVSFQLPDKEDLGRDGKEAMMLALAWNNEASLLKNNGLLANILRELACHRYYLMYNSDRNAKFLQDLVYRSCIFKNHPQANFYLDKKKGKSKGNRDLGQCHALILEP